MADGDIGGCGDHPSDVLAVRVPQLDAVLHVRDVVQVRIRQLAKQRINAEVQVRRRAPQVLRFVAKPLKQAERMELALFSEALLISIRMDHEHFGTPESSH